MNKTQQRIKDAMVAGDELEIRGNNMETSDYGMRYEVACSGNARQLNYWGHNIATLYRSHAGTWDIYIDLCERNTNTTRAMINVALAAFHELGGRDFSVGCRRGSVWVSTSQSMIDIKWDGEGMFIRSDGSHRCEMQVAA